MIQPNEIIPTFVASKKTNDINFKIKGELKMNNKDLCKEFINGATKGKGSNMYIRDNKLYSYSTCICERIVNERGYYNFIHNKTKYSPTTSKQQYYLSNALYGENVIEVDNIDLNTTSLIRYANKQK